MVMRRASKRGGEGKRKDLQRRKREKKGKKSERNLKGTKKQLMIIVAAF